MLVPLSIGGRRDAVEAGHAAGHGVGVETDGADGRCRGQGSRGCDALAVGRLPRAARRSSTSSGSAATSNWRGTKSNPRAAETPVVLEAAGDVLDASGRPLDYRRGHAFGAQLRRAVRPVLRAVAARGGTCRPATRTAIIVTPVGAGALRQSDHRPSGRGAIAEENGGAGGHPSGLPPRLRTGQEPGMVRIGRV